MFPILSHSGCGRGRPCGQRQAPRGGGLGGHGEGLPAQTWAALPRRAPARVPGASACCWGQGPGMCPTCGTRDQQGQGGSQGAQVRSTGVLPASVAATGQLALSAFNFLICSPYIHPATHSSTHPSTHSSIHPILLPSRHCGYKKKKKKASSSPMSK